MADPLRRRLRARALRALTAGGRVVPTRWVEAALRGAGVVARRGRHGARARENLEIAFGLELDEARREAILRGVFRHSARQFATWLRLSRGAPPEGPRAGRGAWIDELVELDPSIAVLDEVHSAGRGVVVVTAHLGDWELLCAALRRSRRFAGGVVGLQRRRDPTTDWLVEMRRAYGVETIPQDAHPRRLLEVLRRGEVLGLLTDLEVRRLAGEFVPFFGRPALTMSAPAALARALAVPLVPVRCVARPELDGKYVLSVEEPLALDPDLDRREAALDLLGRMNDTFERWIREAPEQWAWHQHRWRTAPGELLAVPLAARGAHTDGGTRR